MTSEKDRASVDVLMECIEVQRKKGADYNASVSGVTQAMYYRRGIESINDIIWAKWLRIQSVLDVIKSGAEPNFESLEDSYKDLCNYSSFAVAWIRGQVPGQDPARGLFNEELKKMSEEELLKALGLEDA